MGNDGGSIPTRRELVKNAARALTVSELKATALESLAHAWTHDYLASISSDTSASGTLDYENTVSDWRGRLFNYETILKGLTAGHEEDAEQDSNAPALVNGNGEPITFASTGIKSLKDIVKLKFKRVSETGTKEAQERYTCPVSLKEIGPSTKSVYLVPCGHVFAEVAIKETQDTQCSECSESYLQRDVITILPTEVPDVQRLEGRMEELRGLGLTHSLKKDKSGTSKKKKRKVEDQVDDKKAEKPTKKPEKPARNGAYGIDSRINNPATARLTAAVMAEQEERSKRRKTAVTT